MGPDERLAAKMGGPPQAPAPEMGGAPGMDAGGGGESPEALGQQLTEVLGQAAMLVMKLGPKNFTTVAGPVIRGFFGKIDSMIAPARQAAGQAGAAPGGAPAQAGPPPQMM
jgi:hypothetical protein